MSKEKQPNIEEIVRFLKANPIFKQLQEYVSLELERTRDYYENSEANEFLRGQVYVLKKLKTDLEKWGRKLVLLFPNQEQAGKYHAADFPDLPNTLIYGIDTEDIAQQIVKNMKLKHKDTLPIFIIADTFNRVVFVSQGYTIGLGEQLMKTVKGL